MYAIAFDIWLKPFLSYSMKFVYRKSSSISTSNFRQKVVLNIGTKQTSFSKSFLLFISLPKFLWCTADLADADVEGPPSIAAGALDDENMCLMPKIKPWIDEKDDDYFLDWNIEILKSLYVWRKVISVIANSNYKAAVMSCYKTKWTHSIKVYCRLNVKV